MGSEIAIYLSGSIKKGHEKSDDSFWTDEDMQLLRDNLSPYKVSFLNPAFRMDDLSDSRSVFGRDMLQVFCSTIVFVDARDRRGLGVGAEMMWAKVHKIPVVTWAPLNSHYKKEKTTLLGVPVANFVHPFVESLSDAIVENLADGAVWIKKYLKDKSLEIKGSEDITRAMEHYKEKQLQNDRPMKELFECNTAVRRLIENSHMATISSDR